jgi:cytochrome c biogenesis protein CcdA/glutaredoxin
MSTRIRVVIPLLLLILSALAPALALADQPVQVMVYFSPKCDHCTLVRQEVLDPLSQAYGDKVAFTYVDITQKEGLSQLEAHEARLGQRSNDLPIVIIGDQLVTAYELPELEAQIRTLVDKELGQAAPGQQPKSSAGQNITPSATTAANGAAIHLAYVEKDGCDKCARAAALLEVMQAEYPSLVVTTFNDVGDAQLVEAMGDWLGLPEKERLVAPAVYVGHDALVGDQLTSANLRPLLGQYAASGAVAFWQVLDPNAGAGGILERFRAMGPWAVALVALIDGLNPCAFATIIFFVSYLALSQRPRRELLLVGLAFMLGVFVAYFSVGLGAMSLLRLANRVRILAKILYGVFAATCLVFAGLSLHDYTLARRGKLNDMTLRLPDQLRERIKRRIRKTTSQGEQTIGSSRGLMAFVGLSFASGLFVSLVELACTGQVYLPTISFVVGIPQMRAKATLYLLLYNIIFVLPLLIVLLLAVYGISQARFQQFMSRNVARTKLITAILFVLLGILLLTQVLA